MEAWGATDETDRVLAVSALTNGNVLIGFGFLLILYPLHFRYTLRTPFGTSGPSHFGVVSMGISNPEIQKKVFGPRWQHEIEKQGWPLWKKLFHRLQRCPICKPKEHGKKTQ